MNTEELSDFLKYFPQGKIPTDDVFDYLKEYIEEIEYIEKIQKQEARKITEDTFEEAKRKLLEDDLYTELMDLADEV